MIIRIGLGEIGIGSNCMVVSLIIMRFQAYLPYSFRQPIYMDMKK